MELNISLEEYSGPMDLLLELIKKDELDIYNIPIHSITSSFLEEMEKRTIVADEIAEFISMAAYLLEIKSQMLLPDHELESVLYDEKDPRRYLALRLLDYQRVKEARNYLSKREFPLSIYSDDLPIRLPRPKPSSLDFELDPLVLKEAMESLLNRWDSTSQELLEDRLKKDNFSVFAQQKEILTYLSYSDRLNFSKLIENEPKGKHVASFLALLKLAQDQRVLLHQRETFSEIEIERRGRGNN
ncbi:MAG: segregation/condensation protein A [Tissierellia bacterium]|nr:segregation/condensation protein A [Tissierellia bacterium]